MHEWATLTAYKRYIHNLTTKLFTNFYDFDKCYQLFNIKFMYKDIAPMNLYIF